jgi:hypothetical protein
VKPSTAAAPKPTAAKPPSRPPQFAIPGPPVKATVSIGRLYHQRLNAESVAANLGVTSQGITVRSLTARVEGGVTTVTGWLRTDVPGMACQGRVLTAGADVARVLGAIKPDLAKKISGRGSANIELSTVGFDRASLRRGLSSKGAFRVLNGELHEIPILNALANVTKVKYLSDVQFFQFDGQWRLANGVVNVDEASVVGRLQKIRAKGTVDFDQNVNLAFDLWLGGELKERLRDEKIAKYLVTEADRYLRLPVPIGMTGTLSKPRPSLKLPVDAILDIGVEKGLNLLDEYLKRKQEER